MNQTEGLSRRKAGSSNIIKLRSKSGCVTIDFRGCAKDGLWYSGVGRNDHNSRTR
jgi:hypothetical protein